MDSIETFYCQQTYMFFACRHSPTLSMQSNFVCSGGYCLALTNYDDECNADVSRQMSL